MGTLLELQHLERKQCSIDGPSTEDASVLYRRRRELPHPRLPGRSCLRSRTTAARHGQETTYPYLKSRWEARRRSGDRALGSTRMRREETTAAKRENLLLVEVARVTFGNVTREFDDVVGIGSHPSERIVIEDPTVSRFHCRLARESGVWKLTDLGSKNGTRLNGVRVLAAELERARPRSRSAIRRCRSVSARRPPAAVGASPVLRRRDRGRASRWQLCTRSSGVSPRRHRRAHSRRAARTRSSWPRSSSSEAAARTDPSWSSTAAPSRLPRGIRSSSAMFAGPSRAPIASAKAPSRPRTEDALPRRIGELPLELQPKLLRALSSARGSARRPETVEACRRARDRGDEPRPQAEVKPIASARISLPPRNHRPRPAAPRSPRGHFRSSWRRSPRALPEDALGSAAPDWPGNVRERNYVGARSCSARQVLRITSGQVRKFQTPGGFCSCRRAWLQGRKGRRHRRVRESVPRPAPRSLRRQLQQGGADREDGPDVSPSARAKRPRLSQEAALTSRTHFC